MARERPPRPRSRPPLLTRRGITQFHNPVPSASMVVKAESNGRAMELELGSARRVMSFTIDQSIACIDIHVLRQFETEIACDIDVLSIGPKRHAACLRSNAESGLLRRRVAHAQPN